MWGGMKWDVLGCDWPCARGSLLDALSIAVKAALADTKIPKVTAVAGGAAHTACLSFRFDFWRRQLICHTT